MSNTKKKFAFWLTPKTKELVERSYQLDNSQSQSEFIEKPFNSIPDTLKRSRTARIYQSHCQLHWKAR